MEGLYLHNLIFLALFSDNSGILLYVILGWGKLVSQGLAIYLVRHIIFSDGIQLLKVFID